MKMLAKKININNPPQELDNNIGDLRWVLIDRDNELSIDIDWSYHQISSSDLPFYQSVYLELNGGYADSKNRIYCQKSKAKSDLVLIEKISIYAKNNHPNKLLNLWTLEQVIEMMRHNLILDHEKSILYGRGEAATTIAIIRAIQKFYNEGLISDGFSCDMPPNLFELTYKPLVKQYGLSYLKWKKGGSWGGMPVSVSMLLLADCLKVIESKETKLLVSFFDDLQIHNDFSYAYLITKKALHKYVTKTYNNPPEKKEQFERLVASIENTTGEALTSFDYTVGEISDKIKNIYDAGLMILLQLTGGRLSEIASIKSDWIEPDKNGDWWFTSKINKTNHGIRTIRSIAGLSGKVVDILNRLSFWNKSSESLPLLSRPIALSDQRVLKKYHYNVSLSTLRQRLKDYYADFLNRVDDEVSELHTEFKPHQCRHTWAEYALRRFDGNVLEQIRHHFRHAYGSYYTRRYTDEKLNPEIQNSLEREYLEELILRIAHDKETKHEFFGKVALYIKEKINEKIKTYGVDEIDEMEDEIVSEVADEFERLVPHEWGYCVLQTSKKTVAKCFDNKTKIPMLNEGSSFVNCSGCIHRLTEDSQKEDITRIAISHNDFLNNFPIKVLAKSSKETIKRAKYMLKEIESE